MNADERGWNRTGNGTDNGGVLAKAPRRKGLPRTATAQGETATAYPQMAQITQIETATAVSRRGAKDAKNGKGDCNC
jgi:hypothetical protein